MPRAGLAAAVAAAALIGSTDARADTPVVTLVSPANGSKGRLPRMWPAGRYLACVTAWDKASNRAKACALYRIR